MRIMFNIQCHLVTYIVYRHRLSLHHLIVILLINTIMNRIDVIFIFYKLIFPSQLSITIWWNWMNLMSQQISIPDLECIEALKKVGLINYFLFLFTLFRKIVTRSALVQLGHQPHWLFQMVRRMMCDERFHGKRAW